MKNFDSSFFFFFFNKKTTLFLSFVRVFFTLSFISKKKNFIAHFAPSFLPRKRDDRQTRSHALSEELFVASHERETERGLRALSLTLSCRRLKREDFFFAPFVVVKTFLKNLIDGHHKCTTCISKGGNL